MTSRERVRAAIRFEQTDCIPVGPYMANHCSVSSGYRLKDCYTDGEKLARAQYDAWKFYGQDILTVQADNYYIPEGFGAKIVMPDNADHTPSMIGCVVEDLADVYKLPRLDPTCDGRMHVYLKAMRVLRDLVGDEAALRSCGVGPFTLAAHLRGTEQFLMDLIDAITEEDEEKKEQLLTLIGRCTDILVDFSTAMLDAGADIVQCADSLASLDMISPTIYETFAFPFEKEYFRRMKEPCAKKGAFRLSHICGGNSAVYRDYRNLDADLIEIDSKVDLAYAKEQLKGSHTAMIGNLAPVATIMQGTPDEVTRAAQEAMEKAEGFGFILGSGCEVPIQTPRENILAMIRAARAFEGRVPTSF